MWQARHLSAMVLELHGAVWQAPQWLPSCAWLATPPSVAAFACEFSDPGLNSTGPRSRVRATTTTTSATATAMPVGEKKLGRLVIVASPDLAHRCSVA